MNAATEAIIARQREMLDRAVPGANVLTPKAQMLDASDVQARHPDKALRWVNIRDPQKAASRQLEGYETLSESEGGRRLGDELALMAAPRDQIEAKREAIRRVTAERLTAHNDEMEQIADNVAKVMRDRYGVTVDPKRILVKGDE
jgi:hypothetical protein